MSANVSPFSYKLIAECSVSKARAGIMTLLHGEVNTPVYMPVGTQGTMKGILTDQLEHLNCQIILSNTYHLGMRPGVDILKKAGGLHQFMNWPHPILTDSGGFQMVSLLKLATIDEKGVHFCSPFDDTKCKLTPEQSINIQNVIGADIIMQLDDVIKTTTTGPRVEEAMNRTIRWVDRCIQTHSRPDEQSLFPIVQGGLDSKLRIQCIEELLKRPVRGYAIGGLSGGESKNDFWRTVDLCTSRLPKDKPRYLMGVGFAADMVVCVALGIDMFDCVFPTRTARFGCALVMQGQLNLKQKKYALDMQPIDRECDCSTCKLYTRSYLHHITSTNGAICSLLSIHNIAFQFRLMKQMRTAVMRNEFPKFVCDFMLQHFRDKSIPKWITDALASVNIHLPENNDSNTTDTSNRIATTIPIENQQT